jgi:quinol monooxygenase YgiN
MIIEYIRYRIESERQKDFENAYEKAGKSLKASSHCIGYDLSHCVEEPKSYILRIEWDSQDGHLKGFRASPVFQTFLEAVSPFIGSMEEMRHYEITHAMSKEPSS